MYKGRSIKNTYLGYNSNNSNREESLTLDDVGQILRSAQ